MSTRRVPGVTALLLAALLLAGCGSGAGRTPAPGRTTGGSVSTPAEPPVGRPAPSGSSAEDPGATMPPVSSPSAGATPPRAGEITLTGMVVEGVEANCLLLDAPQGSYLLVARAGVDRSLIRAGARITVRGQVEPGLLSTCQQGTPFLVSEVRPG